MTSVFLYREVFFLRRYAFLSEGMQETRASVLLLWLFHGEYVSKADSPIAQLVRAPH